MTDTNSTPILIIPTISKPSVASSSSATIRRPTQPPNIAVSTSSGPATQAPTQPPSPSSEAQEAAQPLTADTHSSEPPAVAGATNGANSPTAASTEASPAASTTPVDLPSTPVDIPASSTPVVSFEGEIHFSHPPTQSSANSSRNSTENEDENESEWTVDSSNGDDEQDDQDMPAEEMDDGGKHLVYLGVVHQN